MPFNPSNLVLAIARVLQTNGQSTNETIVVTDRLAEKLDLRARIVPRWEELELQSEDGSAKLLSIAAAEPTGVDMDRVAAASRTIDEVVADQLAPAAALAAISAISRRPPAPAWLFTIAAGAGAASLSIIFGVQHIAAVLLITASAAAGAIVRRVLAKYSTNSLLQPFCAALLAGMIGALSVRYNLSSSLRLVAVCPCMILVPGPHVLNGMMDLAAVRVPLGVCRLIYASLIIIAISVGLLLGLNLLNVSLPIDPSGKSVTLWLDVIAAGVAVCAYSIFFSTPLRMLCAPVAAGMLAHGLRWWTLSLGAGVATGAFAACLLVGVVVAPIARRYHMPFAAIGFASVVSLIPGVYLFRMMSGLEQLASNSNSTLQLLGGTMTDGLSAVTIIFAMSLGLIIPKIVVDRLFFNGTRPKG